MLSISIERLTDAIRRPRDEGLRSRLVGNEAASLMGGKDALALQSPGRAEGCWHLTVCLNWTRYMRCGRGGHAHGFVSLEITGAFTGAPKPG